MFVWAGGLKAPELVADSGLPTGYNGRVKVDRYLRRARSPGHLRRRRSRLGRRSAHRARTASAGAGGTPRGRGGCPQLGCGAEERAAGGVHLPRQRLRRLGRSPPWGRRGRRHHQRRATRVSAQRRHRVGIPPIRQAPARLGPSGSVTIRTRQCVVTSKSRDRPRSHRASPGHARFSFQVASGANTTMRPPSRRARARDTSTAGARAAAGPPGRP